MSRTPRRSISSTHGAASRSPGSAAIGPSAQNSSSSLMVPPRWVARGLQPACATLVDGTPVQRTAPTHIYRPGRTHRHEILTADRRLASGCPLAGLQLGAQEPVDRLA